MTRQQIILSIGGAALLLSLWFFGKTVAEKEISPATGNVLPAFNIDELLESSRKNLTISQADHINKLENSISRGDVKDQQVKVYNELASYWGDSLHNHELYAFYISKAAMLVNSEKNLTFAARQILKDVRNEPDAAKRGWKAEQAVNLLQKAIQLNPGNDSLKVDLGACYVFGKGMTGNAEETMKGIQQLLQVVRKDSSNMQAQLILGIGGVISTQYDRAIERLLKVIDHQPGNIEAVSWLADAYAGKGDKANAVKWYDLSKRMVNNPAYSKEVDERIKQMK